MFLILILASSANALTLKSWYTKVNTWKRVHRQASFKAQKQGCFEEIYPLSKSLYQNVPDSCKPISELPRKRTGLPWTSWSEWSSCFFNARFRQRRTRCGNVKPKGQWVYQHEFDQTSCAYPAGCSEWSECIPSKKDMCIGTQLRSCPNNINARIGSCRNSTILESKNCQIVVAGSWSDWSECTSGISRRSRKADNCDKISKLEVQTKVCEDQPEIHIKSGHQQIRNNNPCEWSEWSDCLKEEGYRKVRLRKCTDNSWLSKIWSSGSKIEFRNCNILGIKPPRSMLLNLPDIQIKKHDPYQYFESFSPVTETPAPPTWPALIPNSVAPTPRYYWSNNPAPAPSIIHASNQVIRPYDSSYRSSNPSSQKHQEVKYPKPEPYKNAPPRYPIPEKESVPTWEQVDNSKYISETSDSFWKPVMMKSGEGLPPISISEPATHDYDEPFTDIYPPQPVHHTRTESTYSTYYENRPRPEPTTSYPTLTTLLDDFDAIWDKSFTELPDRPFELPSTCKYSITSPCSEHQRKFKIVICESADLERKIHKENNGVLWMNCDISDKMRIITDWETYENPWQYSTALRSNILSPDTEKIKSPEEINTEPNWTKFYNERNIPENNLVLTNSGQDFQQIVDEGSGEELALPDIRENIKLKSKHSQLNKIVNSIECEYRQVKVARSRCVNGMRKSGMMINQCTKEFTYTQVAC